ncbi:hypothetical protein IHV25_06115 [Phaeovibrio sulfidiphilus]|uniref:Uncharacterized protein n=1 Tax=Phaeovibrio sulfidiphilus TaxID=1220600 RepID=A0A8J6YMK4_9PROT|nr:hypothetical protein [Phaeovibrio sulfidiphilus]MBE1237220.1 hypothetical protein [Phaeovibrio sulfidiphilus]
MDLDFLRYRQADLLLVSARERESVGLVDEFDAALGREGSLHHPWASVFQVRGDRERVRLLAVDLATCFVVYGRMCQAEESGATVAQTRERVEEIGKALTTLGDGLQMFSEARTKMKADLVSVNALEAVAEALARSMVEQIEERDPTQLRGLAAVSENMVYPKNFMAAASDALPPVFENLRSNVLFPEPDPADQLEGIRL